MSSTMSWLVLFLAGLFEIGWAVGLKAAQGRIWVLAATVTAMTVSVALLYVAMRNLPLGTSYAVWTGIGAVGTVLVGIVAFGESADAVRLLCIGLILAGILGLKFVTP
jgi:quaternary ammonium compound-resistance protein SugE